MSTPQITDAYNRLSELAWREKELVNHRVTWLLTSQSVLAAAYGLVSIEVAKAQEPDTPPPLLSAIEAALPRAGLALSFGFCLAVLAAVVAHFYWQAKIDKLKIAEVDAWQYPLFQRHRAPRWATAWLAHIASIVVPGAFLWLWAYLLSR